MLLRVNIPFALQALSLFQLALSCAESRFESGAADSDEFQFPTASRRRLLYTSRYIFAGF